MGRLTYFSVLALCAVMMIPLELLFRPRVLGQRRRLGRAILPPLVLFTLWDLVAIARDHWSFGAGNLVGWRLPFDLPVEELAFFVVVPICAIYSYEAVRLTLQGTSPVAHRIRGRKERSRA